MNKIKIRPYTAGELQRISRTIPTCSKAADDRLEEYEDENGALKTFYRDARWNRYFHEELNAANNRAEVAH